MKQEVIKDFLNLPGIEGLALIDGRSRPFFCGVDQGLNFQQKRALVQGIQQVIETTPMSCQFFQFQFSNRQVYVHKLPNNLILLVLASDELRYQAYHRGIKLLAVELQQNGTSAIANFQMIAGQTALNNLYQNTASSSSNPISTTNPNLGLPSKKHPTSLSTDTIPKSNRGTVNQSVPASTDVFVDNFLSAINALLHLSTDYLGKTMVTNYWKSSRPPLEWLSNFEITPSGRLTLASTTRVNKNKPLSRDQCQWLREWVKAFVQRCARIIRDFPKLLIHGELDNNQKKLLFTQA